MDKYRCFYQLLINVLLICCTATDDPGKCTGECCKPTEQDTQALCSPQIPNPTPTSTSLDISPSLDLAPNAGPTVGVPIIAMPFMALVPLLISLTIILIVCYFWRRKNRRLPTRSRGNYHASSSSISARDLSCSVAAANVDSYRDPVDAVVMMETSNHSSSGHTTTLRNHFAEDYCAEEDDPYQDPDSLAHLMFPERQKRDNTTVQPAFFIDAVTNHSYALLEQSPQYTGEHVIPKSHSSSCVECDSADKEPGAWQYTTPASSEDELLLQLKELSVREISLDHVEILDEKLGIGKFGVVRRGVWSVGEEEREVAVKSLVDGSTEEKRIQFLQEAAIMSQFKHPSIISLHGIVTTTRTPLIVLEILVKGDLRRHLMSLRPKRHWQGVSDNCPGLLLSYCRQVAAGMVYLASRGFVHRDLAARNILISCDDMCKIADFGLARHLCNRESHSMSWTGRIPLRWTAPEAIKRREFTWACDVWSFGVLVWEIWSLGCKPYTSLTDTVQVLRRLGEGYRMAPPPGCPSAVYRLMTDCWHPDPGQRPSFAKVLQLLQRPDFKLLTWTAEDVAAYTEEARTLGAPLEAGEENFKDLQQLYSH